MDTVVKLSNATVEMPNSQMLAFYLQYMQPSNPQPSAYGAFSYGNSRFIAMNTEEVAPPDLARLPGRVVASSWKYPFAFERAQFIRNFATYVVAAEPDGSS